MSIKEYLSVESKGRFVKACLDGSKIHKGLTGPWQGLSGSWSDSTNYDQEWVSISRILQDYKECFIQQEIIKQS